MIINILVSPIIPAGCNAAQMFSTIEGRDQLHVTAFLQRQLAGTFEVLADTTLERIEEQLFVERAERIYVINPFHCMMEAASFRIHMAFIEANETGKLMAAEPLRFRLKNLEGIDTDTFLVIETRLASTKGAVPELTYYLAATA